ncbi:MAG: T9SS type A sorting domain-containing protein [Bacteroidetes bacterium]|nr:T9SS type A sorting domain-containing protein [Bacteroidota bacterium]
MKLKLTYFFLLYLSTSVAQNTIRFNNTYTVSNGAGVSTNVLKYQNKYCLFGVSNNTSNPSQGLRFTKIDSLGNHINTVQIFHPLNYDFTYNSVSNAFIKVDSIKALYTGQVGIAPEYSKATLAKINLRTLDTLWLKSYSQAGDSSWLFCSTVLSDSSIISFGFKYYVLNSYAYSKPFMMKVDKNGNYKWHKFINNNFSNTLYLYQKIIKLSDNDFIVAGHKVPNWCIPQAFAMRIDTNAVKQYEVNFTGIQYPTVADCILLIDGTCLAGGAYTSLSNCSVNPDKYRKYVYKFNPLTGAKISSKAYNVQANTNGILCLVQKTNGIILAGGGTGVFTPTTSVNSQGDVLWLNSNLDSLKSIYIDVPNPADQAAPNQLLLTPDGGFAAAIASYPVVGVAKFWLIKADSNACFSSTCANVGIEELKIKDDELKIYPNPASEILNVEWKMENGASIGLATNAYKIEIVNVLGEVVLNQIATTNNLTLNIHNFNSGIYFMQLIDAKKQLISTRKFIKR